MLSTNYARQSLPQLPAGNRRITDLASLPSRDEPFTEQAKLAQVITSSSIWVTIGVFFLAGTRPGLYALRVADGAHSLGHHCRRRRQRQPVKGLHARLQLCHGHGADLYGSRSRRGSGRTAAASNIQPTLGPDHILGRCFVVLAFGMFGAFELQMPSCNPE